MSHVMKVDILLQQKRADALKEQCSERKSKAASALPEILKRFAWSEDEMYRASKCTFDRSPEEHAHLLLGSLYHPESVVWIGAKTDSGNPQHQRYFRPVSHWLDCKPQGPLICPSVFNLGVCSRANNNVSQTPFLVLDGDTSDPACARKAKKNEPLTDEDKANNLSASLAVINWLRLEVGLVLHAVVDAGNKSAHGWFAHPDVDILDQLKQIVVPLGFDPATFTPSQPVRLPGVQRPDTGRWQRILFLNPITK